MQVYTTYSILRFFALEVKENKMHGPKRDGFLSSLYVSPVKNRKQADSMGFFLELSSWSHLAECISSL